MIKAYLRAMRRLGKSFDHPIDDLNEAQLTDDFTDLIGSYDCQLLAIVRSSLKRTGSSSTPTTS